MRHPNVDASEKALVQNSASDIEYRHQNIDPGSVMMSDNESQEKRKSLVGC